ncbi:MAG: DUF1552 domain-containing protein [Verrucomicrobia bacterium]|nr:DUF1552 domain-containing protein [Verrucomicrobiota bacterium]MBI3869228.1 DUF1552 domain-containing protein [Verrucomicrobiota bacterium]
MSKSPNAERPASPWQWPRRAFLKGLGTALFLPALESISPIASRAAASGAPPPRRTAFVYVPNGANMPDWTPKGLGRDAEFPMILEPLKPHQKDLLVLSGLAQDKGRANGDGAGDHARASASFLTASQPRKTQGADIRVGVSVDQLIAQQIGQQTRLPSLELGCDRGQMSGNCDSGYSCAYSFNIAWKTPSTPLPPETNPRQVFNRLFGNGLPGDIAKRDAKQSLYHKSILDFVMDDARRMQTRLGATDRRKLEEYLTSVRELEQRIERAERFAAALPNQAIPQGIPPENADHIRLMYDLLALAFQTDSTRVATYVVAHDGSNRPYPEVGVTDGHHDLSHHGGDKEKRAKLAKINRHHIALFAEFLAKLKSIPEGNGNLLDQTMIVYGSGLADPDQHAHHDLPVVLAGRGGGVIDPGRHVRYSENTPMANLYLTLMGQMGAKADRMGDSTGVLAQLG